MFGNKDATRNGHSRLTRQDPLTYLPRRPIREFPKGVTIYDGQNPPAYLYVSILGRVKVLTTIEDGRRTVSRIAGPESLFGESCLIGLQEGNESAIALDNLTLMGWTRAEIEEQIEREPLLGMALSQYLVYQCLALEDRIETLAIHKTPERVMLSLLQLANALGSVTADGASRLAPLTHDTIAEYVGTSREIVSFQMNRMRRLGLIRYSRKYIEIYPQAMFEELKSQGMSIPGAPEELPQPVLTRY